MACPTHTYICKLERQLSGFLIHKIFFCFLLLVPTMSAEEDRLWSIVRTNSLDFNAWTALIEETEKIAEVYHYNFFMHIYFLALCVGTFYACYLQHKRCL